MRKIDDYVRSRDEPWPLPNRHHRGNEEEMKPWAIFFFAMIGATATTIAARQLRRTVDWIYTQLTRSQSPWESANSGSFRSSFQEEAWRWKNFSHRMQKEYKEEMERMEYIWRIQSVFNKERSKYKRNFESWRENGPGAYQHFQREDCYWKADTSCRYQSSSFRETPVAGATFPLSHHYSVLGLDRLRTKPYTDNEIKAAFRAKAKEFHPDQNQDNKELAEEKFKDIMTSYEAIKKERESTNL
ncbi:hypothetical protein NMG60_11016577 [Bertholletia excelsa]